MSVSGRTPSGFNWGQNIEIKILGHSSGSWVEVRSQSRAYGILDGGANNNNVTNILHNLSKILGEEK